MRYFKLFSGEKHHCVWKIIEFLPNVSWLEIEPTFSLWDNIPTNLATLVRLRYCILYFWLVNCMVSIFFFSCCCSFHCPMFSLCSHLFSLCSLNSLITFIWNFCQTGCLPLYYLALWLHGSLPNKCHFNKSDKDLK